MCPRGYRGFESPSLRFSYLLWQTHDTLPYPVPTGVCNTLHSAARAKWPIWPIVAYSRIWSVLGCAIGVSVGVSATGRSPICLVPNSRPIGSFAARQPKGGEGLFQSNAKHHGLQFRVADSDWMTVWDGRGDWAYHSIGNRKIFQGWPSAHLTPKARRELNRNCCHRPIKIYQHVYWQGSTKSHRQYLSAEASRRRAPLFQWIPQRRAGRESSGIGSTRSVVGFWDEVEILVLAADFRVAILILQTKFSTADKPPRNRTSAERYVVNCETQFISRSKDDR